MPTDTDHRPDTICARATPAGVGPIAIVRLSGPDAAAVVARCFHPHSRRQDLRRALSHSLIFGHLIDPADQAPIDDVLVAVMHGPHSYTGEDVVEINCHGSPAIVRRLLRLLVDLGARLAEPGEFTRRAFENGQIDLAQAEGICDLIAAQTSRAAEIALRQLEGAVSERVRAVRESLLGTLADIEAHLDFPDEDLPPASVDQWLVALHGVAEEIRQLLASGERGRLLREGVRAVIVGKPNAGKSSLFNSLLSQERAIVAAEPGTTRDSLESLVELNGLPLTLVDTAGFRAAVSEIERLGVKRTETEVAAAALVIFCVPADEPLAEDDEQIWHLVADTRPLVIMTKCDLQPRHTPDEIGQRLGGVEVLETSAVTGEGIETLDERIGQRLFGDVGDERESGDPLVSSQRHLEALRRAAHALTDAIQGLATPPQIEVVAADFHAALDQINLILGLEVGDEILDRIFERFCIGK